MGGTSSRSREGYGMLTENSPAPDILSHPDFSPIPRVIEMSDATMRHRISRSALPTGIDATVSAFTTKIPYESVDYARLENTSYQNRFIHSSKSVLDGLQSYRWRYNSWRWAFCGFIGFVTALTAFFIDYSVELIADIKFGAIEDLLTRCTGKSEAGKPACPIVAPIAVMAAVNMAMVLIAALLCAYIAQCACGSGIPEIKCFLNGIRFPGWLSFKTMTVKVLGVLFSVGASMPVGKEGPMIHSGAIVGAGLPQFLTTGLGSEHLKTYFFHNDRAKRDFVSAGAAAGVAAAFGAPIGGVLFSLEEGCSFWSQSLTWRVFFSSMCCLLMLNFLVSGITNHDRPGGGWGKLGSGGMISFGAFYHTEGESLWTILDLVAFIFMGAIGGVLGGLWNMAQTAITKYRMRRKNFTKPWMVLEAVTLCMINSAIMMATIQVGSCIKVNPAADDGSVFKEFNGVNVTDEVQLRDYFCDEGEFNDMASLSFNTLELAIRNLFHVKETPYSILTCFVYFAALYVTSCWTYGLMIPSGLFVPSLACGAAFGRLVAEILVQWVGIDVNRGTYALIGAAAFLGGVVRMTISLTVILIEATDQVMFSFPLMTTLIVAKWVGDHFNKGIYDIHIHLKKVPLLEFEAETEMKRFTCKDTMSTPVRTFERVNRLSDVVSLLRLCPHQGFPVCKRPDDGFTPAASEHAAVRVASPSPSPYEGDGALDDDDRDGDSDGDGDGNGAGRPGPGGRRQLLGMMLRHQIITMLQNHCWGQKIQNGTTQPLIAHEVFNRAYPQRGTIEELLLELPNEDVMASMWIDFGHYMNLHPITVNPGTTLNRAYVIFRGLGLRHLPVVDGHNCVVGIITRKELTEHRLHELAHLLDHRPTSRYGTTNADGGGHTRDTSFIDSLPAPDRMRDNHWASSTHRNLHGNHGSAKELTSPDTYFFHGSEI